MERGFHSSPPLGTAGIDVQKPLRRTPPASAPPIPPGHRALPPVRSGGPPPSRAARNRGRSRRRHPAFQRNFAPQGAKRVEQRITDRIGHRARLPLRRDVRGTCGARHEIEPPLALWPCARIAAEREAAVLGRHQRAACLQGAGDRAQQRCFIARHDAEHRKVLVPALEDAFVGDARSAPFPDSQGRRTARCDRRRRAACARLASWRGSRPARSGSCAQLPQASGGVFAEVAAATRRGGRCAFRPARRARRAATRSLGRRVLPLRRCRWRARRNHARHSISATASSPSRPARPVSDKSPRWISRSAGMGYEAHVGLVDPPCRTRPWRP